MQQYKNWKKPRREKMNYRALNYTTQTKGKITREQFLDYENVRKTGAINMFGYDSDIQRGDNYSKCYEWFIDKNLTDDLNINLNSGLVEFHLQEQEDGSVVDPMTRHTVFEKGELKC